ncbi:MAG: 23S rRNA (pseudouridine(1915)-N(3))-methyltransferase RlmH [Hyphomicrobiales bacterium]|nr:23S rRNA (pseudouridine(1915)-N(3))-methyltransferase RlmH [Hyphomicrobiales bacterium]
MKILVCVIGRLKTGPEQLLAERYRERAGELAPKLGLSGPNVIEIPESRARDEATRRRQEGEALIAKSQGALRVALDEGGRSLDSVEFANLLARQRAAGTKALAFLIGGADGLAREVLAGAGEIISFGAITLPHQLVRIVLLEQIYRGLTIRLGHPYHRP